MPGEVADGEPGKRGDAIGRVAGVGALLSELFLFAGKHKVDHAREVGFELGLALCVSPGSVASGVLALRRESEITWLGHENVIHEYGRIAVHTKALGELRGSEIFADEYCFSGELRNRFLYQQTCWVRKVSSVGPANQRHGYERMLFSALCRCGAQCLEVGRKRSINDG